MDLRTEFTYDIKYVLAPDGENARTRRVTVHDPRPMAGHGPSLGVIHQALRRSAPEEFGHMQYAEELEIVSIKAVED